nr:AAA family ATPase [Acidimicrobiia bacterium]
MAGSRVFGAAPLVGREAERRLATDVLGRRARRAVVLAGPAGVGKSRLADELAVDAEHAGWEVRVVRVTTVAAA